MTLCKIIITIDTIRALIMLHRQHFVYIAKPFFLMQVIWVGSMALQQHS